MNTLTDIQIYADIVRRSGFIDNYNPGNSLRPSWSWIYVENADRVLLGKISFQNGKFIGVVCHKLVDKTLWSPEHRLWAQLHMCRMMTDEQYIECVIQTVTKAIQRSKRGFNHNRSFSLTQTWSRMIMTPQEKPQILENKRVLHEEIAQFNVAIKDSAKSFNDLIYRLRDCNKL